MAGNNVRVQVSVIVPTLNEADWVAGLLRHLKAQPGEKELIVSDGGSQDGTPDLCAGARIVRGERGRWRQLNRGAEAAEGGIFLFLHADCRLPPGALDRVRHAIRAGAVGGAFLNRFSEWGSRQRTWDLFRDLRSRGWGEVYGDQALFVRRDVFRRLGGFAPLPVMEDLEFFRRMRRLGPVRVLPDRVWSSPRRFRRDGWIRRFLSNQWIKTAYRLRWNLEGRYG
jgi:rSAM/selenodomain-associated transferase 2